MGRWIEGFGVKSDATLGCNLLVLFDLNFKMSKENKPRGWSLMSGWFHRAGLRSKRQIRKNFSLVNL